MVQIRRKGPKRSEHVRMQKGANFTIVSTKVLIGLNTFSFVNSLFVDLCILCVKMKTFPCEESVLCHNKRNCFPSYLDHYLNGYSTKVKHAREERLY